MSPAFSSYIGIDYSGAQTADAELTGLRVYLGGGVATPIEVRPHLHRHWTRRGVAEWLVTRLTDHGPVLVGIDQAFSFPRQYFERYALASDWPAFLDDFRRHWPTDAKSVSVDCVRKGRCGNGAARSGNARWRRLAEERTGSAKSVFHFDVPGSVAKSTHAGLPWLRFIRQQLGQRLHFWPFDGWDVPAGRSVIAEVYPRLWNRGLAPEKRTQDQHDAYCIAAWLSRADHDGTLDSSFAPHLTAEEKAIAAAEGWILGVQGQGGRLRS
jgi:hypothetical protein